MEQQLVGAFPDGEWECFPKLFAIEEHDFTPQFPLMLDGGDHDDELNIATTHTFCAAAAPEASENDHCMFYYSLHAHNSNYVSQESSYSTTSNCSGGDDTVLIANPGSENYYFGYPDHVLANNACEYAMDEKIFATLVPSLADIVTEESVKVYEDVGNSEYNQMEPVVFPTKQLQLKRKLQVPAQDKINNRSENHMKRSRVLKDGQGCMKNSWSKKNQKHVISIGEEAEETNVGSEGQSSSTNISEDDNSSKENSGGATSGSKSVLNSNGKTRASRGSATDPQSLYARKRRERINERLRILQNLVPNGTKVDISTMLEEAVNYVKFLQLQIKLLSSDELWMYAPLAYNGFDIGLNLNMKNSLPL